jgi:hypothetical protein
MRHLPGTRSIEDSEPGAPGCGLSAATASSEIFGTIWVPFARADRFDVVAMTIPPDHVRHGSCTPARAG